MIRPAEIPLLVPSPAVRAGEVLEEDGEPLAHAHGRELQPSAVGGPGAVRGEGQELQGHARVAGEEGAEALVFDGHGTHRFEGGHGGGAGASGQGGGFADDVARAAQGEQGLVAVGRGSGDFGPAVEPARCAAAMRAPRSSKRSM
ncbi:hypothetical protein Slala03_00490 [Streptomyces lavendulae subsp. lavendulae]|nr:hypothetical protein Slala03_00490 [Streptomyces lavendulae subsp. lavendulae]